MKVSVIGAGAIGGNIARRLSEAGHEVLIANARGPESASAEVSDAGAQPAELGVVTQDRDVIILAIPFGVQPKLKDLVTTVPENTVVVDTSNYYPGMNGHIEAVIDGQVESLWSQEQLGRPVVKAWNAALAETQRSMGKPAGSPDRIAIPVAGDSAEARATVMQLVRRYAASTRTTPAPSPSRGASSPAPRPTALSWASRTSVRLWPPPKRTKRRAPATD